MCVRSNIWVSRVGFPLEANEKGDPLGSCFKSGYEATEISKWEQIFVLSGPKYILSKKTMKFTKKVSKFSGKNIEGNEKPRSGQIWNKIDGNKFDSQKKVLRNERVFGYIIQSIGQKKFYLDLEHV